MSWRRCRPASDRPVRIGEADGTSRADRLGDGRHGPHRGNAVDGIGATHRRAVEYGVGKAFQLAPIEMSVRPERPAPGSILLAEDLDFGRFEVPGVEGLGEHAAVLAIE